MKKKEGAIKGKRITVENEVVKEVVERSINVTINRTKGVACIKNLAYIL